MRNYRRLVLSLIFCAAFWCNPGRADLADALDVPPGTIITSAGGTPWFAQTVTTHDGVDAAQSKVELNTWQSTLQLTVNGPLDLSFFWKLSYPLQSVSGSLGFSINDV